MDVARTVQSRGNCLQNQVGAVIVLDNRIVSTGFNGTPSGFKNCQNGGCIRCRERSVGGDRRTAEKVKVRKLAFGPKQLDVCLCVHAEANAMLSAARFGIRIEGTTLYTTHKPCFTCLKDACQVGVQRVVYLTEWSPSEIKVLCDQYSELEEHLRRGVVDNFEQLARQAPLVKMTGAQLREPVLDKQVVRKSTPQAPGWSKRTQRRRKAATAASKAA